MANYNYPAELIKKAETRIRRQLNGNGINPKGIKLTTKRQGLGEFSAQTSYTLETDIQVVQAKGRKSQGEVVESGKTQEATQAYINDLQSKEILNSEVKEKIRSLALKGFGASGDIIQLGTYKKSYTEHSPCGTCQGKGQATCATCRGQGQSQCQLCFAQGTIRCLYCNGLGEIQNGNQRQVCNNCQGRREIFCTQCHGQKMAPCGTCQTKGTISCGSCDGGGINSLITSITPIVKITSAINLQELDDEPKIFANKVGAITLAKGMHVDIEEAQPPKDEEKTTPSQLSYYQDNDISYEDADKTIYYSVTMPWAVVQTEINNKKYSIAFVGKKGAICDADHFMDDLFDKPFKLLRDAAKGNGFVAGLLKGACDFRVSRETLSAVTTLKRKKAMVQLSKKYSVGLTKQSLHAFVQNAYLALKRITRRPRYIGLCVGLILSAAIYYYWFINGGRSMTYAHTNNIRMAMDTIPLVIAIIMTIITIKGAGFFVFKNLMHDIGVKTNRLPAAGTAGLYGLLGNLLLWGSAFGYLLIH